MNLASPQEALRAYIAATNAHDFRNVRQVLRPDALFWFCDATAASPTEVQAYFERAWRIIDRELYAAADVRWIAVGRSVASCVYTYTYEGYLEGVHVTGQGRATNVFVRNDEGEWKLIHEHLSAAPNGVAS